MRIGIDGRLWSQTGIGRYIKNICTNLSEIDKKNGYVLFVLKSDKKEVEDVIKNKNWKIVAVDFRWHSLGEQIRFPGVIKKEKVDLMHFTYQQGVPIFYKKPFIITIHDLIKHHYLTGKASTGPVWLYGFKMLAYKILINSASRNAKKIIAVSNTTRDEIFDHLMVNKKNVEVVYEAADDFESNSNKNNDLGKYFLYVGNIYPHKNVENLMKAFYSLSEKKEVKLVFVGSNDYFYQRFKNDISKLINSGKVIVKENITDSKLAEYYSNAVCLIRPSLMEGFSLPPLEALQSGCLVLASDIPVHKEIFGDSVIYFNPNDIVDMEKKMDYVLNLNDKAKEEKIKEGKLLTEKFSWEKAAKETLKIYESSARL